MHSLSPADFESLQTDYKIVIYYIISRELPVLYNWLFNFWGENHAPPRRRYKQPHREIL